MVFVKSHQFVAFWDFWIKEFLRIIVLKAIDKTWWWTANCRAWNYLCRRLKRLHLFKIYPFQFIKIYIYGVSVWILKIICYHKYVPYIVKIALFGNRNHKANVIWHNLPLQINTDFLIKFFRFKQYQDISITPLDAICVSLLFTIPTSEQICIYIEPFANNTHRCHTHWK